jgi:hypothetical protein
MFVVFAFYDYELVSDYRGGQKQEKPRDSYFPGLT